MLSLDLIGVLLDINPSHTSLGISDSPQNQIQPLDET